MNRIDEHRLVCSTKTSYATKGEAMAFSKMRSAHSGQAGGTYQCLACGKWHVTLAASNHFGYRSKKKPITFRDRMRGKVDKYGIRR